MMDGFTNAELLNNVLFGTEIKLGGVRNDAGGPAPSFGNGPLGSPGNTLTNFQAGSTSGQYFGGAGAAGNRHVMKWNLLLALQQCVQTCTESFVVELHGPGELIYEHNRVSGAMTATLLGNERTCGNVLSWVDNVMIGNQYGFHTMNCGSLPLQSWRNAIGVIASPWVRHVKNMELIENGVGFINCEYRWFPEIKPSKIWRRYSGTSTISDSVIIGRAEATKELSYNCDLEIAAKNGVYTSGGMMTPFTYSFMVRTHADKRARLARTKSGPSRWVRFRRSLTTVSPLLSSAGELGLRRRAVHGRRRD